MAATAEAKPRTYRFADPAAAKLAPGERGVRLRFGGGADSSSDGATSVELFAHPFTLRACSGVMAALLESCGGGGDKDSGGKGSGDGGGGGGKESSCNKASTGAADIDPLLTVPLCADGDDLMAWDEALTLMYGVAHGPVFEVGWESAGRLLVLADKYDMPGIAATVARFLRAKGDAGTVRLQSQLACGGDALRWLRLTSRSGLSDLAKACIGDIVSGGLSFTAAQLRELDAADADALLDALAAQRKDLVARAAALEARANKAEKAERDLNADHCKKCKELGELYDRMMGVAAPIAGRRCAWCKHELFVKPDGKPARFCLNCGKKAL